MLQIDFSFSDTISGYVTRHGPAERCFEMRTSDGRLFEVRIGDAAWALVIRNLDEPHVDATGLLDQLLQSGQMVMVYGTFYPGPQGPALEAQTLHFTGKSKDRYRFEEPDWWVNQALSIGDFFIHAQFGKSADYDFRKYRTTIDLTGKHADTSRQETDTISRMIYGLASVYLLTGEDRFLDCSERGVEYLREHMRFYDRDEEVVYWYHGIDVHGDQEEKIFSSEFGDDYDAIPMYEQIYALAGPIQVYRASGDPAIRRDLDMTMDLFERFFKDKEKGGYFSHVDPIFLSPHAATLGSNQARKNWNSVGDHAPAYLINAWLALGDQRYADFLLECGDLICRYFPDFENSPFVQERFHADWSHDSEWGWQQDRAVVGHNLKIAWNLMRLNSLRPSESYVDLARKIADLMPGAGSDLQRFGWYDVVERRRVEGERHHRFVWHDRKAWWQQEQGILAYQILDGCLDVPEYRRWGREGSAFYNAFFLDHNDGSVYFNVLNNGVPFLLGNERFKGSHSMSCYHSIELCYLAAVYTNLLRFKRSMDFHFKPHVDGFPDNILRVAPDILPPGSIEIEAVWVDGSPHTDFDARGLTVQLPRLGHRPKVRVRIAAVGSPDPG